MNCSALHRELLSLERLDPAPADARVHLAECAACRTWFRKLTTVERLASQTIVPPPRQKAAFIERFLAQKDEVVAESSVLLFEPNGRSSKNPKLRSRERAQRKTALAVALAASLALIALGIWAWQGYRPGGPTGGEGPKTQVSRLQSRLDREPRWAAAKTQREKVEALDGIAVEMEGRMRTLAAAELPDAQELSAEVELYCAVIEAITAKEAPLMPRPERLRVLEPIANRLLRVQSDASILANRHTDSDAAASLRRLAATAHDAHGRLMEML